MNRLATLAAGCALLSSGCLGSGTGSVWKALTGSEPADRVATPDMKGIPPASHEVAARVERVGKNIIDQNTFTGLEPNFMTIGIKEATLFHRGVKDLIISQGIVEKCGSDAELAAVLCSELGQMVVEKRLAMALGREADPTTNTSAPLFPEGTATEVSQQARPAAQEKRPPGTGRVARPDPARVARELLSGAGYNPLELDRVDALLKPSERGETLRKQLGTSAPPPEWQK